MPLARPTLGELVDRVSNDMRGRLEIGGPLLRRAMVKVLAPVWAGAIYLLYGFLDWWSRQLFGDTAEREQLLRKAAMYGIVPAPATFATGSATVTGTNGSVIGAESIWRLDANTAYRVTTGQTIASGTATLPLKAILAGSAANVPEGTVLTCESPIAGVSATATVTTGGIIDGEDQEDIEVTRSRYLLRLREPPEGGADQDYEAWALAVAGVTRAWVYENELGLGTVVVRFVMDNLPNIFPDVGSVAAVQAALDAERPLTARPTALAPTELDVNFTIHVVPDNADTRTAVAAELADLLSRVAEPGDGIGRGEVLLSKIRTAIDTAEGVTDYALTSPSADVVPGVGQLPVLGTITWV